MHPLSYHTYRNKWQDFILGKFIYLIYLSSYLIFIALNNLLSNLYYLFNSKANNLHFLYWGVWCQNRNYDGSWVIKHFVFFEFLKLVFIVLLFLYYKKSKSPIRKLIFEICIAYLLFDMLYLVLGPIADLVHFDLNWYFGSMLDQLLINKTGSFYGYVISLFWVIVLWILIANTDYKNLKLKDWVYKFAGVFISFFVFCGLMLFAKSFLD